MIKVPYLVSDYLEDLSGEILEQPKLVEEFVGGRPGIYALYRKGNLYYVGLAKDLKTRLKQHKKDKHAEKWDRFSVFITTTDEHLKDLESLLLLVTKKPEGNKVGGKFTEAKKQNKKMLYLYKQQQKVVTNGLFNILQKPDSSTKKNIEKGSVGARAIRAFYKGGIIKALLKKDETVRLDSKIFSSLSAAASHVTGHATNGRVFWRRKNSAGESLASGSLTRLPENP